MSSFSEEWAHLLENEHQIAAERSKTTRNSCRTQQNAAQLTQDAAKRPPRECRTQQNDPKLTQNAAKRQHIGTGRAFSREGAHSPENELIPLRLRTLTWGSSNEYPHLRIFSIDRMPFCCIFAALLLCFRYILMSFCYSFAVFLLYFAAFCLTLLIFCYIFSRFLQHFAAFCCVFAAVLLRVCCAFAACLLRVCWFFVVVCYILFYFAIFLLHSDAWLEYTAPLH